MTIAWFTHLWYRLNRNWWFNPSTSFWGDTTDWRYWSCGGERYPALGTLGMLKSLLAADKISGAKTSVASRRVTAISASKRNSAVKRSCPPARERESESGCVRVCVCV